MASTTQKNTKRASGSTRGAGRGGTSAPSAGRGRSRTSSRNGSPQRGSSRNGVQRGSTQRGASGKKADAARAEAPENRTPQPVGETAAPVRRRKGITPARRKAVGVVMAVLALCSFFGAFGSSAILLNWLGALLKGLFGYGYWLSVPVFAFSACVLLLHPDKPGGLRTASALLLVPVTGVLGHILLCRQSFPDDGLFTRLWTSGQDMTSGGLFSGTVAGIFTRLFAKPVSVIVFFALFLYLLTSALRLDLTGMADLIRRRLFYGSEWDEWQEDEDDWTYSRAGVVRSDEDTQRVYARQQFDFPVDGGEDRWNGEDRWSEPPNVEPWDGGITGGTDSGPVDAVVNTGGPQPGMGIHKLRTAEKPQETGRKFQAAGKPQRTGTAGAGGAFAPASGAVSGSAAGSVSGSAVGAASGSAAGTAGGPTAAAPDGEADPRKARAAASREVAAQAAAVSQEIARKMAGPEKKYRFPSMNNLYENKSRNYVEAGAELRGNSRRLADTLNSFGVDATPGDVIHGPSVTRYEYTLEQGVKLSKITNLADDIALALGATGVRIAPIPTKSSVVGIEVPNRQVTPVLIRDVVASQDFRNHPSTTAFALGKDIGGKNIIGSIEQLPHVLIAGTTGSGKSVCTNSLIISMLYHARPDQVKFIMVDPKMVELAPYNGIPHLLIPVVTDPKKAAGALQWGTVEMMKRYRTFSEHGVKKLSEYNRVAETQGLEPMPSIVVVIDELADLMMAAAKEVEESIVRMAQMGRAAGMHLVIATQRPSADVITGLMKANIPSRIAFAVASAMESRIILDTPGAEKLVGKGDMLYAPLGESRIRVQGCYIAPEEIERVVAFVKQTSEANYDNEVIAKIEATVQEKKLPEQMTIPDPPQEADELLPAAVEVVLETGQASVSMLQRRLKLGYSRAARLVDQMEEKGYVGPFEGSKPRQLLLTQEKWQELKMAQTVAAQ